jgi:molybdopterin converting factor small subunit
VRVEVQLFATLARYLPPESRGGTTALEVPEGASVHQVIERLGIPPEFERVMLVNGREAEPDQALRPDDVGTVFPPLAGGRS